MRRRSDRRLAIPSLLSAVCSLFVPIPWILTNGPDLRFLGARYVKLTLAAQDGEMVW
jgi:hypothetical protein